MSCCCVGIHTCTFTHVHVHVHSVRVHVDDIVYTCTVYTHAGTYAHTE